MDYMKLLSACVAVAITGGSFAMVATPVEAKSPIIVVADSDIVIRSISYADLNLASASGEATLNGRVGGGIKSLCLEATDGADSGFVPNVWSHKCRTSAWNQARPQVSQAVRRARDIAQNGFSPIAAVAITITVTK
jgi:UrcA family protein